MQVGSTVRLTKAGECVVWMYSHEWSEFDECENMRGVVEEACGCYVVRITLDGELIRRDDDTGLHDTWNFAEDEIEEVVV